MSYETDALIGFAVAFAAAAALTPLTIVLARRTGAMTRPSERALEDRPMPQLGGVAMLVAIGGAGLWLLPEFQRWTWVLWGAAAITLVGALDDRFDLSALVKITGQTAAAAIPVVGGGVAVRNATLPFVGGFELGWVAEPVTILALVAVMNIVNLIDGADGLAAGVCAIIAAAFSVIAFDLGREGAGVLAALTAGGALGFLVHNFPPAKVFMGDSGANLLGYLLAVVAVEGAVKTQAFVTLLLPLVLFAVPALDMTFVVLKRLKYRRPVYRADAEHFHHRLGRIGYSKRRVALFLYGWTLLLAGLALAIRFVPYSDDRGDFDLEWSLVLAAFGLVVAALSVLLVRELEILKFRRFDRARLRRLRPDASEAALDEQVERDLRTGEFQAVEVDPETGEFTALR